MPRSTVEAHSEMGQSFSRSSHIVGLTCAKACPKPTCMGSMQRLLQRKAGPTCAVTIFAWDTIVLNISQDCSPLGFGISWRENAFFSVQPLKHNTRTQHLFPSALPSQTPDHKDLGLGTRDSHWRLVGNMGI